MLNQHGGFDGPHGIEVERRRTQESETASEENGETPQRRGTHGNPRQEGRRQAPGASGSEAENHCAQGEAGTQEDSAQSGAESGTEEDDRRAEHSGASTHSAASGTDVERARACAEAGSAAATASGSGCAEPAAEAADAYRDDARSHLRYVA